MTADAATDLTDTDLNLFERLALERADRLSQHVLVHWQHMLGLVELAREALAARATPAPPAVLDDWRNSLDVRDLTDEQLWAALKSGHRPYTPESHEHTHCVRCMFRWPCPVDRMLALAGRAFAPATADGGELAAVDILLDGMMERRTADDGRPYLRCSLCRLASPLVEPERQSHRTACPVTLALARRALALP